MFKNKLIYFLQILKNMDEDNDEDNINYRNKMNLNTLTFNIFLIYLMLLEI